VRHDPPLSVVFGVLFEVSLPADAHRESLAGLVLVMIAVLNATTTFVTLGLVAAAGQSVTLPSHVLIGVCKSASCASGQLESPP